VADKIVEGRLAKFYEEVCLYEQPFVKENTITVDQLIKTKIAKLGENITVSRFARFKVAMPWGWHKPWPETSGWLNTTAFC